MAQSVKDHEQSLPASGESNGRRDVPEVMTRARSVTAGNAALVREGLKPNLSAAEATSQLKVLCRKFAALTEKVKEETRVREEAEKEVRRLKAIIEANGAPVIASTRAENHACIRDLKEAQEALKQDLQREKELNAKLVSKALELEREKSALLAASSSAPLRGQDCSPPLESSRQSSRSNASWDREQAAKIHNTLRATVEELQEELTIKEGELDSYRERLQRERSRVKVLEQELHERDEKASEDQSVLRQLESTIQEQREQFEAIEKEVQAAAERIEEEETIRRTLEQQIETLNDVNAALEQRAKTLVRRLELSHSLIGEIEDLKAQVRDVEIDKETLVCSIKDTKENHSVKETQWKAQIEQLRAEKLTLTAQITDLKNEISSLRTQNSLLSEWMLVRSENVAVTQQQQQIHNTWEAANEQRKLAQKDAGNDRHRARHQPHDQNYCDDLRSSTAHCRVRPCSPTEVDDHVYSHISPQCPLSPSKTRSMTTASPILQSQTWFNARRTSTSSDSSSISEERENAWAMKTYMDSYASNDVDSRKRTATKPILRTGPSNRTEDFSNKISDHERLRELMSRNRALKNQLKMETVATRNLEQEISQITCQRMSGS